MSQNLRPSILLKPVVRSAPVPRKSERTRQSILDGALEFLWSLPFREMTVAELMSITGTSRSAFYRYFNDLHNLMETLLQGIEEDLFEAATPWLRGGGEPIALLHESLAGLVRVCYQRGPILRAVADASTTDPLLERS
ncbi:MAG: TetR/AcrR family transcriptional regulator [Pirellulales bacterium]